VKSRPEKQIAAAAIKKTNWEIMARKDLDSAVVSSGLSWGFIKQRAYKTTMWFEMAKKASLFI
jgi:hypothetical protein